MLNATVNDAILTSFAVLSDGYQIAIGFDSGAVILFTGKFLQEMGSTSVRSSTHTTLLTSHAYPVSNLYFCEIQPRRTAERRIRLFAVMDTVENVALDGDGSGGYAGMPPPPPQQRPPDPGMNGDDPKYAGVLIFDTSISPGGGGSTGGGISSAGSSNTEYVPAQRHPVRALDDRGAPPRCSTFMRGQSELVVARAEAVYNYSVEDRGGALAIGGDKLCICAGNID